MHAMAWLQQASDMRRCMRAAATMPAVRRSPTYFDLQASEARRLARETDDRQIKHGLERIAALYDEIADKLRQATPELPSSL